MNMNKDINKEKRKAIKLIILVVICLVIIIIASFLKKDSIDQKLFKAGFRQNDTFIYEKIEDGMSYQTYLSSLEEKKNNLSYLLDLDLHQITKNDQSLVDNNEEQISITWQFNKNKIVGYYSLENLDTNSYISFEYNLDTSVFKCSGEDEICNKMKNKSFEFINDIEELFNKNKITFDEL